MIADAIRGHAVPIDTLRPHPRNPRQGDIGAISESLRRFGQYRVAVVQESTGYVVVGNHMLAAARALGWTELAAIRMDLTDDEAARLMVADNRTSDLATNDDSVLLELLDGLASTPDALEGTGYDTEDMDRISRFLEQAGFAGEQPEWTNMPSFSNDGKESVFSTTVHFRSTEDADAFYRLIGQPGSKARSCWWPESDGHIGSDTNREWVRDATE